MMIEWFIPMVTGMSLILGGSILILGLTWLATYMWFRTFEMIVKKLKIDIEFLDFVRHKYRENNKVKSIT